MKTSITRKYISLAFLFVACLFATEFNASAHEFTVGPGPTDGAVFAIQPSCIDGAVISNGYLQLSSIMDGDRLNFSTGSSYGGDTDYANALIIGALPFQFAQGLSNPSGTQDYTIRIFNGATDCFTDYVVTMEEQDCVVACNCQEYVYLNEPTTNGAVHKYLVNADGSFTEIGSPWFDNTAAGEDVTSPHGVGIDLNGFVYIGERAATSNVDIRKFNCDGEIFPESEFAIPIKGLFNITTIGNSLYANPRNGADEDYIIEYDICSGAVTGGVDFCEVDASNTGDWGLYSNPITGEFYATSGFTGTNYFWYFNQTDFDTDPSTCISAFDLGPTFPSTNADVRGVVTDADGNVYIAVKNDQNISPRGSYVLKYGPAPTFTYIGQSIVDSAADGVGFNGLLGLVYSETTNLIFGSTDSRRDDCVSTFDTDLNYLGQTVPTPGGGDNGKGIALVRECCPVNNNIVIDTIICEASLNDQISLQELIKCGGVICEGQWVEGASNSGFAFDGCDNSVTVIDLNACGSFTLGSDGTGNNPQCGAFNITVNIEIGLDFDATVIAVPPTCANGVSEDNGYFEIQSVTNSTQVNWSLGSSYSGDPDPANGITIGALPFQFNTGIANPTGSQSYTVRVFNSAPGCNDGCTTFMDYTFTIAEQDCRALCEQVSGEIFYDLDADGCEGPGEGLVMEPVMVSLYTCGDVPGTDLPVALTMIMDGSYEFGLDSPDPGADICLDAMTEYFVVFEIPNAIGESLEEYTFTSGMADAMCTADGESSDVDPASGASECHNPDDTDAGDGDSDENIDAGIVPPCENLAGEIFYDENQNGCEDAGEPLVMEAVNVTLYQCGDIPGVDLPVAATMVSDGTYEFGEDSMDPGADVCLMAGTEYFVVFDIPNGAGEALAGYEFTPTVAPLACAQAGESDDVAPSTGASGCYDPNDDDSNDGDLDNNVDAGIIPPCHTIAGEIFYDENENGCEDAGEALVTEIVMVMLYECGSVPGTDLPFAMTVFNDGTYEFGENSTDPGADVCLDSSTEYFVVFEIPNDPGESLEGYTFTTGMADMACESLGESDDVDPATGASVCVNADDSDPGDGAADQNVDAGIVPPCQELAGEIFYDVNEDGCQDAGENLVMEAINVSLFSCGAMPGVDMPVASTTVNDGDYEFGPNSLDPGANICLSAGDQYFVVFDIPNAMGQALQDYTFTSGIASGACATSGESDDVDASTGASSCYDPSDSDAGDGDGDQNIDAGIVPPCHQLAGEIFYDLNENGCEDAGESLVMEAVNVTLYTCGAISGVDPPVASTVVTDGQYEFGVNSTDPGAAVCLDAGTIYFVVFDIPNGTGGALEVYTFTSGVSASCAAGSNESNDVGSTGASACFDPSNDAGDGDNDEHIDAGIVPPCHELAGEIFYDLNENGCEDVGESLVMETINVSLYSCGDTPGVDMPVASTTVTDGDYEFGPNSLDPGADICLLAGDQYFVVFDIPNAAGEALEDYSFTSGIAAGACATSGESDDVDASTGASSCYDPSDNDAGDGTGDQNIDAGIVPPCQQLSGEIFYDLNENGCEDAGESLVMEAVNVTLYTCGAIMGVDPPVASTVVTDGQYEFGENSTDPGAAVCLDAGTIYFVVFDIPNGTGEALEDYTFTAGVSASCAAGSNESNDVGSTGASACFDPSTDAGDGDNDDHIDAGIVAPCETIGGEIFVDNNENGCQDAGESLVTEPVVVSLYTCGSNPDADAPLAMTTVADGDYMFGENSTDAGAAICLEAGVQYFVVFDIPNGAGEVLENYAFTMGVAAASCFADGTADDVDPSTGSTSCHDAEGNDDDEHLDVGITPPCEELAGEIFYDLNENGCQDAGETLVMEAVMVSLYTCSQTPGVDAPMASTTVTDGSYEFGEDSTDPGADYCLDGMTEYFVVFDIPNAAGGALEDYTFTTGMADATCETIGNSDDVDPSTGGSACYDPTGDDDDNNIDAGIVAPCESVAGEIFYDDNQNGCQDGTEALVTEAVTVTLYTCGSSPGVDAPVAMTTVSDGDYAFEEGSADPGADVCLDAGTSYFVVFDIPNGTGEALEDYAFTDGIADAGCFAAGDADDVDPATGASTCYNADGDDDDNHIDAGIVAPCESLAGEIFFDLNDNGCQDPAELLVMELIEVSLYTCGDMPGTDPALASTFIQDGDYEFGPDSPDAGADVCLSPGTQYFVVFDIPNAAGEALEDFVFSTGNASAGCEFAGESDDVDPTTGASSCFDPNDDDASDGNADENIDAGIVPPCEQIAGEIFYDDNNNGCEDANETLVMEAVNVTLYQCGDMPGMDQPVATTTVTDGDYVFGDTSTDPGANVCLMPGESYFVVFDFPFAGGQALEDYYLSTGTADPACALSGEGDNVDPTNGYSSCYDPDNADSSDGDGDENIDVGIVHPCEALAGEIFYDLNHNGCHDTGEGLVQETVGVSLYNCGDTPGVDAPLASTSVSDGTYNFSDSSNDPGATVCLNPRFEYFVVFDLPVDAGEGLADHNVSVNAADATCVASGQSSDADPTTSTTACYNPDGEDDDNNIDVGIYPCEQIGGEVFYDYDNNGCKDGTDASVTAAVTVSLFECSGGVATGGPVATTTTINGEYVFGLESPNAGANVCLDPAIEYLVVFDLPNGAGESLEDHVYSSNTASAACEAAGDADDVDPSTGSSTCYNPSGNDDDDHIDAGIVPPFFDLMLVKQLANGQSDLVEAGDQVVFELVITNLTQPLADNIVVNDIIPNGLSFDPALNPQWTETNGVATTTLTVAGGELPAGGLGEDQSVTVQIVLSVNHNVPQGVLMDNLATIEGNDDNPDNDSDNEVVSTPITDLSIEKTLATGQSSTVDPGSQVTYNIIVTNEGTSYIGSAYLTDEYPSMYLTLNDANWIPGMTMGTAIHTAFVDLQPGESYSIPITFDVSMYSPGMTLVNTASITSIFDENNDPMDDSNPDNNIDDEPIDVANTLIYDMSLTKVISANTPAPYFFGDVVEFDVVVCNDGNTAISNFVIEDELSSGFQFVTSHPGNADWNSTGGSTYTQSIATIPMNSCVTLKMYASVMDNGGPWVNDAVISSASTPAGTPLTTLTDISGFTNNLDVVDITPMDPSGVIGSCVFKDVNGNGVRDIGEPGIPSIRVELYTGTGTLVEVTTTDALGNYMFMDLFAGSYYLTFILQDGYQFTTANQGNNDNNDSDVDGSNGPGTTATISLSNNEVDMSLYAGLFRCIPFGDLIWLDTNGNNRQDPNENGINGVRVDIFNRVNNVWTLQTSTYTGHKPGTPSDDGHWKICLPPGEYYVKYNMPSTLRAAVPMIGGVEFDSNVTGAFGDNTTNSITLESCTEVCNIDAGYQIINGLMDAPTGTQFALSEASLELVGQSESSYNALEWTLSGHTPEAVSHYVVLRSTDGKNFEEVAKIPSDGQMQQNYKYEDYDLANTDVYEYQIKAISNEGADLSIEQVKLTSSSPKLGLYPNPVTDLLYVKVDLLRQAERLEIVLYDMVGQLINGNAILDFGVQGSKEYNLDVSSLDEGIYNLRVDIDGKVYSEKVIVVNR